MIQNNNLDMPTWPQTPFPHSYCKKINSVLAENQDSFEGMKAETEAKKTSQHAIFPHTKDSSYGIIVTDKD